MLDDIAAIAKDYDDFCPRHCLAGAVVTLLEMVVLTDITQGTNDVKSLVKMARKNIKKKTSGDDAAAILDKISAYRKAGMN